MSISLSGSLVITGSIVASGGITGSFSGSATTSSYALTASSVNPLTQSLSVSGSITATGILTAQTLVVQTITSSIVYSSGSNIFGNQLTNVQQMTGSVKITGSIVQSSGQVVIGATQSTDTTGALLTFPMGSFIYWGAGDSGNTRSYGIRNNELSTGDFTIKSSSTNTGALDSVRFQITKEGNVGIGGVAPASQATGATSGILDISAASGGNLVLHRTSGGDTALFSILKASNGTYIDSTGAATAANNAIYFRNNDINADQTSLSTRLTIASGGNVGIGTSTPFSNHRATFTNTSVGTDRSTIYLQGIYSGTNPTAGIDFGSTNGTAVAAIRQVMTNTGNGASDISFHTWDGSSLLERMRITNGGVVQITGLTSNGTVSTQSSNGSLYVSSDANLKIEDGFVENGLEKVLALKPRYFYWKDKEAFSADRQLGFYAQEVNAVSEETANTPPEGCGWGIYDRGLVALLTKAIQEQQATITSLQEQINELKNK